METFYTIGLTCDNIVQGVTDYVLYSEQTSQGIVYYAFHKFIGVN